MHPRSPLGAEGGNQAECRHVRTCSRKRCSFHSRSCSRQTSRWPSRPSGADGTRVRINGEDGGSVVEVHYRRSSSGRDRKPWRRRSTSVRPRSSRPSAVVAGAWASSGKCSVTTEAIWCLVVGSDDKNTFWTQTRAILAIAMPRSMVSLLMASISPWMRSRRRKSGTPSFHVRETTDAARTDALADWSVRGRHRPTTMSRVCPFRPSRSRLDHMPL